jgi:hypothetical protein
MLHHDLPLLSYSTHSSVPPLGAIIALHIAVRSFTPSPISTFWPVAWNNAFNSFESAAHANSNDLKALHSEARGMDDEPYHCHIHTWDVLCNAPPHFVCNVNTEKRA